MVSFLSFLSHGEKGMGGTVLRRLTREPGMEAGGGLNKPPELLAKEKKRFDKLRTKTVATKGTREGGRGKQRTRCSARAPTTMEEVFVYSVFPFD